MPLREHIVCRRQAELLGCTPASSPVVHEQQLQVADVVHHELAEACTCM